MWWGEWGAGQWEDGTEEAWRELVQGKPPSDGAKALGVGF